MNSNNRKSPQCIQALKTGFLSFLILSLISCTSSTSIKVLDNQEQIHKDVKIYVDNEYKGDGEIVYSDRKIHTFTDAPTIDLKLAECNPVQEKLNTETDIWRVIGSLAVMAVGIGIGIYTGGLVGESIGSYPLSLILGTSTGTAIVGAATLPSLYVRKYKPFHTYYFHCDK